MDECHFQQHGSRLASWFHCLEKDPVAMHAPTRKKIGIIGAVCPDDGKLVFREESKFNAETINIFFEEMIQHRNPEKKMLVVLDNARFHHAKALEPWLDKHVDDFKLEFLPPYSPELNHIERVWKLTRRLCTHNQYFEDVETLRNAVIPKFEEWFEPNDELSALCAIN